MLDKSLKNILHEAVIVINYNNKFKERMKIWKIRHVEKGDKISIFIVNIFSFNCLENIRTPRGRRHGDKRRAAYSSSRVTLRAATNATQIVVH